MKTQLTSTAACRTSSVTLNVLKTTSSEKLSVSLLVARSASKLTSVAGVMSTACIVAFNAAVAANPSTSFVA